MLVQGVGVSALHGRLGFLRHFFTLTGFGFGVSLVVDKGSGFGSYGDGVWG